MNPRMLKKTLIVLAVNIGLFIICAAIVEAMARRGFNPISRIAAILSPAPSSDSLTAPGVAQ